MGIIFLNPNMVQIHTRENFRSTFVFKFVTTCLFIIQLCHTNIKKNQTETQHKMYWNIHLYVWGTKNSWNRGWQIFTVIEPHMTLIAKYVDGDRSRLLSLLWLPFVSSLVTNKSISFSPTTNGTFKKGFCIFTNTSMWSQWDVFYTNSVCARDKKKGAKWGKLHFREIFLTWTVQTQSWSVKFFRFLALSRNY